MAHLGRLTVHRSVFTLRFAPGCATRRCDAACCSIGVQVDVRDRERVLAHADLIRRHMTPEQDHDPARWFKADEHYDRDFPSGRAVSTRVGPAGCVFLDADRRCVLQKASAGNGLDLKPFFCAAYPVTVSNGVLLVDDMGAGRWPHCCGTRPDGQLSLFDVCATELEYALGVEGADTLRRLAEVESSDVASPALD